MGDEHGPQTTSMLAPLRVPQFRYQFSAQTASVVGSTISPVALSLGVLQLTNSAQDFGLILAASSVPTVLFLLAGGVWADRLPRHKVMISANLVCAATQAGLGAMLVTGQFQLWLAVILQFCSGTALAFYYPSTSGLTAHTVPKELLQKANAMLSLVRSTAGSIGPLVASGLFVAGAAGWALLLDAISFLVSAVLLSRLRLPERAAAEDRKSFLAELRAGLREVTTRSWVWSSIVAYMFSHLAIAMFWVLGPLILMTRGTSAVAWGLMVSALSVGQILGDVLALRWVPRRPLVAARLAELLAAPVLVCLVTDAPVWLLLVSAGLGGFAMTFPDALWYSAMQQHLPIKSISRVSSYDWLGSLALRPLGYLFAGALAQAAGAGPALTAAAVAIVVTRLAGLMFRDVRNLASQAV